MNNAERWSWSRTLATAGIGAALGLATVANAGLPNIAAGAVGHSIAVDRFGNVYSWGANVAGQLGNGTNTPSPTPINVPGLSGIQQVASGSGTNGNNSQGYSLAVRSDGVVFSWGYNGSGQLGLGNTSTGPTSPTQVPSFSGALQVAAGNAAVVAVKKDGTVWAWGDNSSGQLGKGDTFPSSSPLQVPGLTSFVKVSVGGDHVLALRSDGTVWAWGGNFYGEIGNGSTLNVLSPVQVGGLPPIVDIAASFVESYALGANGEMYAWGYNLVGELGDMSTNNSSVPVQVLGFMPEVGLLGNGGAYGEHGLAIAADGRAWLWGWGSHGQMGDGLTTFSNPIPRMLAGTPNQGFRYVAEGNQNFGIRNNGSIRAWGANVFGPGELGTIAVPAGSVLIPTDVLGVGGAGTLNLGSYAGRKSNFSGTNGDGWLFWRFPSVGANTLWRFNGNAIVTNAAITAVGPTWTVAGTGDLNGDGRSDIIWIEAGGSIVDWTMNGTVITSAAGIGLAPAGWALIAVADVNGDGKDDLVFRQTSSGAVAAWLMDGTTVRSVAVYGSIGTNYSLAGVGDFDGNGSKDLLWMDASTGAVVMWQMYPGSLKNVWSLGTLGPGWAATVGDFNGDGRSDIMWRQGSTNAVWYMAGGMVMRVDLLPGVAIGWNPVGVMAASNNGNDDIIWLNSGTVVRWTMNGVGNAPTAAVVAAQGAGWQVVGQ